MRDWAGSAANRLTRPTRRWRLRLTCIAAGWCWPVPRRGGLWRSKDGGRSFDAVDEAPEQVNALIALANGTESASTGKGGGSAGWLLSDDTQLWSSQDGSAWSPIEGSTPALCMLEKEGSIYVGGENGVTVLNSASLQVERQLQIPPM